MLGGILFYSCLELTGQPVQHLRLQISEWVIGAHSPQVHQYRLDLVKFEILGQRTNRFLLGCIPIFEIQLDVSSVWPSADYLDRNVAKVQRQGFPYLCNPFIYISGCDADLIQFAAGYLQEI